MKIAIFTKSILLTLFAANTALAGNSPHYRWNENRNPMGPHRCSSSSQCDRTRSCSSFGWCEDSANPPARHSRKPVPQGGVRAPVSGWERPAPKPAPGWDRPSQRRPLPPGGVPAPQASSGWERPSQRPLPPGGVPAPAPRPVPNGGVPAPQQSSEGW